MRAHAIAPLAALLALAGCNVPDFTGPEEVRGLRVLAVRAEPPELGAPADAGADEDWPAGSAAVESLVGHPNFAATADAGAVVLHLGCTPAPGEVAGTVCTRMSELTRPSDLLQLVDATDACAAPGRGAVEAITFSGLEACGRDGCGALSVALDPTDPASAVPLPTPTYSLPDGYALSSLPAGHPRRVLGVDVVDVALALEAAPEELAPATAVADPCAALGAVIQRIQDRWSDPTRDKVAALKWIHVRGPDMPADSPPNHNPSLAGMTLDGTPLPAPDATPLAVTAGRKQDLLPALPGPFDDLRERWKRFDTDGNYVDTRTEDWGYSWFTTAGKLEYSHTTAWDERNQLKPVSGPAVLWLVVRDLRGGEAWTAGVVAAP